jgi:hypothetical protein
MDRGCVFLLQADVVLSKAKVMVLKARSSGGDKPNGLQAALLGADKPAVVASNAHLALPSQAALMLRAAVANNVRRP